MGKKVSLTPVTNDLRMIENNIKGHSQDFMSVVYKIIN
jgi:hypothetical protein